MVRIHPNFSVETGGAQSLRVMKFDDLKRKVPGYCVVDGGNAIYLGHGYKFTRQMADRFGGKKLKLYEAKKVKDIENRCGTNYHMKFSADGNDSFQWNEFMFVEFWNGNPGLAIDRNKLAPEPVKAKPVAQEPARRVYEEPASKSSAKSSKKTAIAPRNDKGKKLIRAMLLMSLLQKK